MALSLKLMYFDFPGRAEPARLLFMLGKVPYEDSQFGVEQWPALKSTMPFQQVPVLEVGNNDDKLVLAQSGAIYRYAAKLVGLYPEDLLEAAKTEMAAFQVVDLYEPIIATFYGTDHAAAIAARAALLEGQVGANLAQLDKLVASSGADFVLGGKMSWVDIVIYSVLSNLVGGFFEGMPVNLLDKYPALQNLHQKVAAQPNIAAHYAGATHPLRRSYKVKAVG